jgi:hypothetical protein
MKPPLLPGTLHSLVSLTCFYYLLHSTSIQMLQMIAGDFSMVLQLSNAYGNKGSGGKAEMVLNSGSG